jgi:hypothetical protein
MRETPTAAQHTLVFALEVLARAHRDNKRLVAVLAERRADGYPQSTMRDGPSGRGPADPTAAAVLGLGSDLAGRDLDAWYASLDMLARAVWQVEATLARWHREVHPEACRNRLGCPDHADRAPQRERCYRCDAVWRESEPKHERTRADDRAGRAAV